MPRGRPKGSKNKPKADQPKPIEVVAIGPKRGRGRPKGSKNKPKEVFVNPLKEALRQAVEALPVLMDDIKGENTFYHRHKGPFTFNITRRVLVNKTTGKTELQSEHLPQRMDAEDVESEALALLNDPRDTIISVTVWSTSEEQFVTTFKKRAK